MEKQPVISSSRRNFIKVAAVTAYVAPLIASMPAHATYGKTGSAPQKPPVNGVKPEKPPVSHKKKYYKKKRYSKYFRKSRSRRG